MDELRVPTRGSVCLAGEAEGGYLAGQGRAAGSAGAGCSPGRWSGVAAGDVGTSALDAGREPGSTAALGPEGGGRETERQKEREGRK